MTQISHSVVVPYTPKQLFDLVNNVQAYSEFIPYCAKSEVHAPQEESQMVATLTLEYWLPRLALLGDRWQKGEVSFTTRNSWKSSERIDLELVKMATSTVEIQALTGCWTFEKISDNETRVSIKIDITLSNTALSIALYAASNFVAQLLINTFTERAKAIYDFQSVPALI